MKLLNLTELSHLGICWADRAIFLKVACGQAFAVRPPSRTPLAAPRRRSARRRSLSRRPTWAAAGAG